jgi:sodium-dependent phosphate transporter
MLAFTCALAGAASWVMWCTRHSAHVSSTYSLVSAVAGVGVATVGASKVQWGWNKGKGLGAIFAGLGMAPAISACFGAAIFCLIKFTVHIRKNPVPWAIFTSPFFFLIAGTICTLSIVYKGSPKLGLNKKPSWYVASVVMGVGGGLCLLSALFFVPYVYVKVVKRDQSVKWWMFIMGPALLYRQVDQAERANVPNYAVVQHDAELEEQELPTTAGHSTATDATALPKHRDNNSSGEHSYEYDQDPEEKLSSQPSPQLPPNQMARLSEVELTYEERVKQSEERFNAKLRQKRGPLGWAMRTLHANPMGPGAIYERHNLKIIAKRIPAMITCGALYGLHYDIHAAQSGISGTPEGDRMERTYAHAKKYSNEVEHTYSFVQVLTACTASFAHGANDIGNSVGPWAVIYGAWSTGDAAAAKAPVPIWQLVVLSATISIGLITYGYNIMKGKSFSHIMLRQYYANIT